MGQYFFGITKEEKDNILNQHRTIYDGYVTEYGKGNNETPLYVQDFANDKEGITVSNKGEVKTYTNMNINESHSGLDMIGDGDDDLINGTVDIDDQTQWEDEGIEYISLGLEDECEDCGEMEEGFDDPYIKHARDGKDFSHKEFKPVPGDLEIDMTNFRDDSVTPKKYMQNKIDDFDKLFGNEVDSEDDDFDPIFENDFTDEVDEDILPELTQKINESLDMFKRFKKYN